MKSLPLRLTLWSCVLAPCGQVRSGRGNARFSDRRRKPPGASFRGREDRGDEVRRRCGRAALDGGNGAGGLPPRTGSPRDAASRRRRAIREEVRSQSRRGKEPWSSSGFSRKKTASAGSAKSAAKRGRGARRWKRASTVRARSRAASGPSGATAARRATAGPIRCNRPLGRTAPSSTAACIRRKTRTRSPSRWPASWMQNKTSA